MNGRHFECAKCLFQNVTVSHTSAEILGRRVENLVCECERCGFQWTEKTSDSPKEKKEESL